MTKALDVNEPTEHDRERPDPRSSEKSDNKKKKTGKAFQVNEKSAPDREGSNRS